MRSAVTDNLGYAVPVATLRELLNHPAPIKIDNWLTIGALNPKLWKATEAHWTQRAGRILVRGTGEGFGGRALCIHQQDPPEIPYEVAVSVKLDDESGAGGLIFCSDGGDTHYGFYPTAGKVRLTRFEGPDVSHWTILEDTPTPHYKPGEWNHLRVRVEPENISCFLNGHQVIVSNDTRLRSGKAGLCKFRATEPEFKSFRVGKQVHFDAGDAEVAALRKIVAGLDAAESPPSSAVPALAKNPEAGRALLAEEISRMEKRTAELRSLSARVHELAIRKELTRTMSRDREEEIDLGMAALLIAKLDNPDVDVPGYLAEIDRLADELRKGLGKEQGAEKRRRFDRLVDWMCRENGFHGSEDDYQSKSNSYLNEVIDDREGLPITLSILCMELGRRLDVPVAGIPLPGHFVVQFIDEKNPTAGTFVDVFDKGRRFDSAEAKKRFEAAAKREATAEDLRPATKKEIILRMLRNLIGVELDSGGKGALPYLNVLLALSPEEASERLSRAIVLYQSGQKAEAREDIGWLLEKQPPGVNLDRLQEWYDSIPGK
jgi:regulator of sirC expression with transglutaminase-like and TPR domain